MVNEDGEQYEGPAYEDLVDAIVQIDQEVAELQRTRATLVARCEKYYPGRRTEPAKPAAAPSEPFPPPLVRELDTSVRLDQLGTKEIAEQVGVPSIEVLPLHHIVLPDGYTYRRVLIEARDIPEDSFFVVLREQPHPEAHLLRVRGGTQVAVCGRRGDRPGFYWLGANREDMETEVELCQMCASFIPGVRVPL
jgi:hypothetical protein